MHLLGIVDAVHRLHEARGTRAAQTGTLEDISQCVATSKDYAFGARHQSRRFVEEDRDVLSQVLLHRCEALGANRRQMRQRAIGRGKRREELDADPGAKGANAEIQRQGGRG